MRVIAVVGIRSQYIKLCSLQRTIKNNKFNESLEMIYVDAGQHYDYSLNGFISELGIEFDYHLTYEYKDPLQIFSEMIFKLCMLFRECNNEKKVDYIMCFGDANTTMATAIAASKTGIKLVHVEAGLRLGNLDSPEEGNRLVADHLSTKLFVSNKADYSNIIREGLKEKAVFTGDIIKDLVVSLDKERCLDRDIQYFSDNRFEYSCDDFIIASMHRKENVEGGCLKSLFKALDYQKHNVLFIAHPLNYADIRSFQFDEHKITIAKHIPYYDMLAAMKKCKYIITDSGAFQREAYYLSKRCLIRQDIAFWQHLVEIGAHMTVGKMYDQMCRGIDEIEERIKQPYPYTDYFGDGHAVERILSSLVEEQ